MAERLEFNLLQNGLDYLFSAAEHARVGDPRGCKYSLLHLVAGIELLVKARLQEEHWSLLFADIDKASTEALSSGDFRSVDFDTACRRLTNIASVAIEDDSLTLLNELRKLRHRAQHFAIKIELQQIRSLLAKGLNFSLDFCRTNLFGQIGKQEEEALQGMHMHLRHFEEFVEERMSAIEPVLKGVDMVYTCPECQQEAVAIRPGERQCYFCNTTPDAEELAYINGEGPHEGACLNCGAETLCFVLYNNEEGGAHCTSCGFRQSICLACLGFFVGEGEYCQRCHAAGRTIPKRLAGRRLGVD